MKIKIALYLINKSHCFCRMNIGIPKINHELILLKLKDILRIEVTKI